MKSIHFQNVCIFSSIVFIISCNAYTSQKDSKYEDSLKNRENELLKMELEIKRKELELKERESEIKDKIELPISELYKIVKQGVFIIYTKGYEGFVQGTGFFLSKSGTAISNYHVFEKADRAIVVLDNGEKYMITKIIAYDRRLDYVIFQVGLGGNEFRALEIATNAPDIGEHCFTIGNPKGLSQTLSIGNISAYRDMDNLIQTTTEITHGSSGGPLFNRSGQVVGITTSGLGEANLNFAVNINKIAYQDYLDEGIRGTASRSSIPYDHIKEMIKDYYEAVFNKDYGKLMAFYSDNLDRYYSEFNISAESAISNGEEYWTKFQVIHAYNEIKWNTLSVEGLDHGSTEVKFNMDYFIQRQNKNKATSFNLDIIIIVDEHMKISSIYENIVSSNK